MPVEEHKVIFAADMDYGKVVKGFKEVQVVFDTLQEHFIKAGMTAKRASEEIQGIKMSLTDTVTRSGTLSKIKEHFFAVSESTDDVKEAMGILRKEYDPLLTVSEDYQRLVNRSMRYTARDIMRVGGTMQKLGGWFEKNFTGKMISSSLSLNAVLDDVNRSFETMFGAMGEAIAPVLEPFAGVIEDTAEGVAKLPEPILAVIGGFTSLAGIVLNLIPITMTYIGTMALVRSSLIASNTVVTTSNAGMMMFGKRIGSLIGQFPSFIGKLAKFAPAMIGISVGLYQMATGSNLTSKALGGVATIAGGIAGLAGLGLLGAASWVPIVGAVAGVIAIVATLASLLTGTSETGEVNTDVFNILRQTYDMTASEAANAATQIKQVYDAAQKAPESQRYEVFADRMEELGYASENYGLWYMRLNNQIGSYTETAVTGLEGIVSQLDIFNQSAAGALAYLKMAVESNGIDTREWDTFMQLDYATQVLNAWCMESGNLSTNLYNAIISGGVIDTTEWTSIIQPYLATSYFGLINEDATEILGNLGDWLINPTNAFDWTLLVNSGQFTGILDTMETYYNRTLLRLKANLVLAEIMRINNMIMEAFARRGGWTGTVNAPASWNPVQTWTGTVTAYQKGGFIEHEGLAYLHAGETVIPAGENTYSTNVTIQNASIRSDQDIYALAKAISEIQSDRARRKGIMVS